MGALLIAVGAYVGFVKPAGLALSAALEGIVLMVVGFGLAVAAWVYLPRRYSTLPDFAVVSAESIIFGRSAVPSSLIRLDWDAPRQRFAMYDRTKLHAKLGEKDRFSEFAFVLPGGPAVPISKALFDTVMSGAKRRDFELRKSEISSVEILNFRATASH